MQATRPPEVMGVLNVTPDSFSDGGLHLDPAAAIARVEQMLAEGASCIDVGGESTRPGAAPVPPEQECERVIPVIEAVPGGVKVKVGSVAHPMLPEHHIEWIEVLSGEKVYRQALQPGEPPEAFFPLEAEGLTAREYCNLHGLWKNGG